MYSATLPLTSLERQSASEKCVGQRVVSQARGYRTLKKWLSYGESKVLGCALFPHAIQHFTDVARRIAAIRELVN